MKRFLTVVVVASVMFSCGNGSGSGADSDDTTKSITPPPTGDTLNTVAPMMGDTSKTEADSLKK